MRQIIVAVICAVVFVGVSVTFVEAVNPNGKYSAKGRWVWKKGNQKESGTHAGAFKLKGTRITGIANSSDGCTARYKLKLSPRPRSKTGKLKLTGLIVDICNGQKTTYKVTKGVASYKTTRTGKIKYSAKLVSKGIRGADKGSVLAANAKGVKK